MNKAVQTPIPLTRPYLSPAIKKAVLDVLESGHWTEGPVTRQLEENFQRYIGCRAAVAVTSCTVGLELALRALSIGAGDEVIIPDFTHPATACAVLNTGATAVVVGIDPETMLIDYDAMETAITPHTKALMPVSLFGNPLDWQRLQAIRRRHPLFVVEDAACAAGAEYDGKRVGTQADITVFSLHPRKMLAVGEGGLIATNDQALAAWMRSYKYFGTEPQPGSHLPAFVRDGSNHKLSDILAAVGVAQLAEIEALLNRREQLCQHYELLLQTMPNLRWQRTTANGRHSRQSFCVQVDNRDAILANLRGKGIEVQIGTFALHREPVYKNHPRCRFHGDTAMASQVFTRGLTLPLFHDLQPSEQEYVVHSLRAAMTERPCAA